MSRIQTCAYRASIIAGPLLSIALLASGSLMATARTRTSLSPARMQAIETCVAQARSEPPGKLGMRRREFASCMRSKGQRP
jgi:hypothetical protein